MVDTGTTSGWYPDPRARFELRYHNGQAWTADVSTGGERFVDPLGTRPAAPAAMPPAPQPGVSGPANGQPKNSPATASMILGIIAICIGWMPFVVVLGIIGAALAIALGVKGRRRAAVTQGEGAGFALAGLITGAVALLVCVGGVIFSIALLRAVERFENPAEHDASITSCELDGEELTAVGEITNTSNDAATFTVRIHFVRPGTDNAQREITVDVGEVDAGDTAEFEASRQVGDRELECTIGAVRGPLPYGADPGT